MALAGRDFASQCVKVEDCRLQQLLSLKCLGPTLGPIGQHTNTASANSRGRRCGISHARSALKLRDHGEVLELSGRAVVMVGYGWFL
jgi:hypothetical protein